MDTEALTIVTGGGRGIGRAIALRMAKETAVLVVGRTENDLNDVCGEITRGGGRAGLCVGDVTKPLTARSAASLRHLHGTTIRNLICNAGIGKSGPTETYDPELWDEIMRVNVNGAFHFIQACLPPMIESGGGTIVLMSSISGLKGSNQNMAYVASKHALVGMANALAREHGKHGIIAVAVCPGYVEGSMTDRSIARRAESRGISLEEAREQIAKVSPQRRILPPEEVAEAVAFVCSRKVLSLSGNPLVLNGGG